MQWSAGFASHESLFHGLGFSWETNLLKPPTLACCGQLFHGLCIPWEVKLLKPLDLVFAGSLMPLAASLEMTDRMAENEGYTKPCKF